MHRKLRNVLLLLLVAIAFAACGEGGREPTMTPLPVVIGRLVPWSTNIPIDARRIVLCRIQGEVQDGDCVLMGKAATTDQAGKFSIMGAVAGTYFVLYDSGLSDFDEAMELWGGKMLHFGDMDWLSEFLGVDLRQDPVEFRVPEGISHSPHEGWLTHYCTLTLSIGYSPFIVAHDMELAEEERDLHCLVVDVIPGQIQNIDVQATYFGER